LKRGGGGITSGCKGAWGAKAAHRNFGRIKTLVEKKASEMEGELQRNNDGTGGGVHTAESRDTIYVRQRCPGWSPGKRE